MVTFTLQFNPLHYCLILFLVLVQIVKISCSSDGTAESEKTSWRKSVLFRKKWHTETWRIFSLA